MANVSVEVTLSGGAKTRKVAIDGDTVSFASDGKGKIEVDGNMGDGSNHALIATMTGPVGAKMEIKLTCGGIALEGPEPLEVDGVTEPWSATDMIIKLKGAE